MIEDDVLCRDYSKMEGFRLSSSEQVQLDNIKAYLDILDWDRLLVFVKALLLFLQDYTRKQSEPHYLWGHFQNVLGLAGGTLKTILHESFSTESKTSIKDLEKSNKDLEDRLNKVMVAFDVNRESQLITIAHHHKAIKNALRELSK